MTATTTLSVPSLPSRRLETVSFGLLMAFVGALQVSIAAAQILLAAALLGWIVTVIIGHERVVVPRFFWPLVAYAGWTVLSSLLAADPVSSFRDNKQLLLFLIVPATLRLARGKRAHLMVDVLITIGAITAVIGIVQYGILHYDNLGKRPQGTLGHYMTYSGVLMLVISAAAARLVHDTRNRVWTALVMPALLVALSLTFTRSAWVGACAALALLVMLREWRLLGLVPIVLAVAVALAPARLTDRVYSMFDLNDPTNRDRVAMLKAGSHMVADHPLTGVGPDQVKAVYEHYRDASAVEPLNVHLHNVPMQIAAERGLPALALWIAFVVSAITGLWHVFRRGRQPALAATALAAIVAMLAAGMFEYNFGDSEFLMLFLTVITLPYAFENDGGQGTPA